MNLRLIGLACLLTACTDRIGNVDGVHFDDCSSSFRSERCLGGTDGAVGGGPMWSTMNGALGGGFIDGRRLVVAELDRSVGIGSIYAIDLTTGNRTLISGLLRDARYGEDIIGEGPGLEHLVDVRAGDHVWFAITSAGIMTVDPTNGARALWFRASNEVDCGYVEAAGIAVWHTTVFAVARTHTSDMAIVEIESGQCRVVSMGGETPVGAGPAFVSPAWLALDGRTLFVADRGDASVLSVDLATGDRVRVSSNTPSHLVGGGQHIVGGSPLSVEPDGLWTSGTGGEPIRIDVTTGDRVELSLAAGGPANDGLGHSSGGVWRYPDSALMVVVDYEGVLVINGLTGESNWLSR